MKCLVVSRKDGKGFYKSSKAYPIFGCRCENCKKWKSENNKKYRKNNIQVNNKKYSKKYYENNKSSILLQYQSLYKENKEQIRNYQSGYFKTESGKEAIRRGARKRRARKKNNLTIPYTEKEVLDLYGSLCHICKKEIDLIASRQTGKPGWEYGLHIDHVLGISLGGADSIDNVKPSHAICNLTKKKKNATIA